MNIDDAALAESLRRLAQPREDDGSIRSALHLVVTACVDLFHVGGAGILIADEQDMLAYAASSDGPGRILETTEAEAGEGPCTEAFVKVQVVATHDITAEAERWPRLAAVLADQPVRAVLGVPVLLGGVPVGTLDVYQEQPHHWDYSEIAALVRYAEVISTTLAAALQAHTAGQLAKQLQYALDYRVLIERSVGFLMAKQSTDAVAAFNELRNVALRRRTKIGKVAEHVLEHGVLPD